MRGRTRLPAVAFNARNVTVFLVTVMTLGILWSVVAQWIPPSPDMPAFDSYSGTVLGFRGIHDLLEELGPPVRRNTQPPPAWLDTKSRVVLLQPSILAVELEKEYLKRLHTWVEAGGEIVLASDDVDPNAVREALPEGERAERFLDFFGEDQLLKSLGIEDLTVVGEETYEDYYREDSDDWRHIMTNVLSDYRRLDTTYTVHGEGTLAYLAELAPEIELPHDYLRSFEGDSIAKADGRFSVSTGSGAAVTIAVEFTVGAGRVIVVAEPALFTNPSLAIAPNAVVAYHLIAGSGLRPVLIDEYYHGSLSGRNALHVLTLMPFPIVAGAIFITVLLWAWSQLVRFGPPQEYHAPTRRSILEYVDAMARLYKRGRKQPFILKTLRDGTLARLRQELHLPSATPEAHLFSRLAQRDASAARDLVTLVESIDAALSSGANISTGDLSQLQGKLETCRWKNSPQGSQPIPLQPTLRQQGSPTP